MFGSNAVEKYGDLLPIPSPQPGPNYEGSNFEKEARSREEREAQALGRLDDERAVASSAGLGPRAATPVRAPPSPRACEAFSEDTPDILKAAFTADGADTTSSFQVEKAEGHGHDMRHDGSFALKVRRVIEERDQLRKECDQLRKEIHQTTQQYEIHSRELHQVAVAAQRRLQEVLSFIGDVQPCVRDLTGHIQGAVVALRDMVKLVEEAGRLFQGPGEEDSEEDEDNEVIVISSDSDD